MASGPEVEAIQAMNGIIIASLIAGTIAFGLTALAIVGGEPLARRFRLLDVPGGRKDHHAATPVTGGPAIILGIAVPCLLFLPLSPAVVGLLAAGFILIVVGLLDDLYDVPWYLRLAAQCGATIVMIVVGDVRVELLGEFFSRPNIVISPLLVVPLTVLATVGLINALNMCDGVDGLAGLQSLCALILLVAAAFYSGNTVLAQGLIVIVGGILAFLMFNMRTPWHPRARAFLGNSGSAFLGLIIAWSCFRLTQDVAHPVTPVLAPFFVAPPVIDCLVLMARRVAHGKSPFSADRTHMHHILLDAGFRPTTVVFSLAAVSLVLGSLAAFARLFGLATYAFPVLFILVMAGYFAATYDTERAVAKLEGVRKAFTPTR